MIEDFEIEQGWKYGKIKDSDKKTHPCLVEFEKLPDVEKIKDILYVCGARAAKEFLSATL